MEEAMQKKFLKEISLFIDALERDTVLFIHKYNSRLNALEHKYDPDEPRAPAGGPDGGQWVSGGSGSSALGQNDDVSDDLGTGDSLGGVPTDGINPLYPELIAPLAASLLSGIGELLSGGAAAIDGALTAAEADATASQIASGHAFEKHVLSGEFLGISTEGEFSDHISNILQNPSEVKALDYGRTGFWDDNTGTLVVKDPGNLDGGTAFRPDLGKTYFDTKLR